VAVVAVENLCKRYPGAAGDAVQDVSFTVADREFMVLLGPSGCGKSTVLRMIAGLEPITSGTVAIDGRVMNSVPAKARDIAMVFQSYALYPHMTVFDNLAFGLRRRDVDGAEVAKRVRAAAAKLGLGRFPATQAARACRAASGSGSPSAARSCATPRSSSSTSRCRTSTPRCA
jgi:multiple sugar transport system ATP-binding protein